MPEQPCGPHEDHHIAPIVFFGAVLLGASCAIGFGIAIGIELWRRQRGIKCAHT